VLAPVGVLLAGSCTLFGGRSGRPEPPEPSVRLWLPGVVRWTGDRREVALELENATDRSVRIEAPAARRARVTIFLGPGPDPACGVEPDEGDRGPDVTLAPGESVQLTVDLGQACARLPPGEYRYEVGYQVPAAGKGKPLKARVRYGHVLVEAAPAGTERGSLGSGGATRSR
jgi:hypothetical protein